MTPASIQQTTHMICFVCVGRASDATVIGNLKNTFVSVKPICRFPYFHRCPTSE